MVKNAKKGPFTSKIDVGQIVEYVPILITNMPKHVLPIFSARDCVFGNMALRFSFVAARQILLNDHFAFRTRL